MFYKQEPGLGGGAELELSQREGGGGRMGIGMEDGDGGWRDGWRMDCGGRMDGGCRMQDRSLSDFGFAQG